jgi:hypothetical protein
MRGRTSGKCLGGKVLTLAGLPLYFGGHAMRAVQ